MKIEKINENKIRIVLRRDDFKNKQININQILLTTEESQKLFLEILTKAEKEVNFDTKGHKLLIEALTENDDIFIFTITKYLEKEIAENLHNKKTLKVRKKTQFFNTSTLIYKFSEFENFCEFCEFLHNNHNIATQKLYKSAILYLYNNTYYLAIDGINLTNSSLLVFHSILLEFSSLTKYTKNFKFKLREHGKVIIKNNAINTGIRYFAYKK